MQDIDYQLEKLERLAKLLEAGAISQTEYEEEKLSLLKPSGDEKSRQAADLVSSLRRGSPSKAETSISDEPKPTTTASEMQPSRPVRTRSKSTSLPFVPIASAAVVTAVAVVWFVTSDQSVTSKTENVAVSSVASIADKADDSAVVPATDTPAVPAQVTPEPQSIVSTIADITGAERRYLDQAVAMRCGVAEPANTRVQVLDFNRDGRRDFLFVSGQSAESECRGNAAYVILALSSAEGTFEPTLLDGAEMIDRQTLEVTDKRCDGFIGRTQLRWAEPEWSVVENCVPLDIGPDPAGFEEEGHDP